MATKNVEFYGVVSTTVERIEQKIARFLCMPYRMRYRRIFFLPLDCDSQENAIAAATCLKRDGINWVSIESSPDHYWLITDFVGTIQQIIDKMETIVGVDPDYIKFTKNYKIPFIRATPTIDREPRFVDDDVENLRDKRVIYWFRQYQDLVEEQKPVLQNMILLNALKNNEIYSLAADPEFDI